MTLISPHLNNDDDLYVRVIVQGLHKEIILRLIFLIAMKLLTPNVFVCEVFLKFVIMVLKVN